MRGIGSQILNYVACAGAVGLGWKSRLLILWWLTKNLRVRFGMSRYNPSEVYSVQTVYGPLFLRDNFGDVTNLVSLVHSNVYHARRLDQPGVILDVGANIGLAAAMFHHFDPERTIYSFEPLVRCRQLITGVLQFRISRSIFEIASASAASTYYMLWC